MTKLGREGRIAFLAAVPCGTPIQVETMLAAGFPLSCGQPSFWSGGAAGARLAFDLGCKVVFSRKLLTVTLVRMDDDEKKAKASRLDQVRKIERQAYQDRKRQILRLQAEWTASNRAAINDTEEQNASKPADA